MHFSVSKNFSLILNSFCCPAILESLLSIRYYREEKRANDPNEAGRVLSAYSCLFWLRMVDAQGTPQEPEMRFHLWWWVMQMTFI